MNKTFKTSIVLIFIQAIFIFPFAFAQSQSETVHLNRYEHFTKVMKSADLQMEYNHFQSKFDETIQNVLVLKPAKKVPARLFFFFHGMDGDAGDAVVARDLAEKLDGVVVSIGGRGASWVSDAFLADAGQTIANYSKGFEGFYLVGVSMGGTQALALSALLPEKLSKSIRGVIAIMPGIDLEAMLRNSTNDSVRTTLLSSTKADSVKIQTRSPIQLVNQYKTTIPFVIAYSKEDHLIIQGTTDNFISALVDKGIKVETLDLPGDHVYDDSKIDYAALFKLLYQVQDAKT